MKKFLSILLLVIIIIILIVNVLSIFEISFFGFRLFKVASGSMEPDIPINSLILIRETDDYKEGDIVTFKDYTNYTTHRIIKMDEKNIITKGDANNIEDKPVSRDVVVGKLIFSINLFKFVSKVAVSPFFWIIIFLVGIILIFKMPKWSYIKKPIKRKKRIPPQR